MIKERFLGEKMKEIGWCKMKMMMGCNCKGWVGSTADADADAATLSSSQSILVDPTPHSITPPHWLQLACIHIYIYTMCVCVRERERERKEKPDTDIVICFMRHASPHFFIANWVHG